MCDVECPLQVDDVVFVGADGQNDRVRTTVLVADEADVVEVSEEEVFRNSTEDHVSSFRNTQHYTVRFILYLN